MTSIYALLTGAGPYLVVGVTLAVAGAAVFIRVGWRREEDGGPQA